VVTVSRKFTVIRAITSWLCLVNVLASHIRVKLGEARHHY